LPASILYLDASALVKLILPEAETIPLLQLLLAWPYRIASQIAFVEVHRAVRRATTDEAIFRRAEEVLSTIHFMDIHQGILGDAALLGPTTLRSLDAIHVASASSLLPELGGVVTYDRGMTEAAKRLKLPVLAPA
jgi:predicted nucleic acid-binding protein